MAYSSFNSSVPRFSQDLLVDVASVPASSVSVQAFAIPGVEPAMHFQINMPAINSGLVILSARCLAAGTLQVLFLNVTGSDINQGVATMSVVGS